MKYASLLILLIFLATNLKSQDSPQSSFYFGAERSLANFYQQGNLEEFWQFINTDPNQKLDQGSTAFMKFFLGQSGHSNKNWIGTEAQLILTNSHAIWGTETFFGGRNEIYFSATFFNIVLKYGRSLDQDEAAILNFELGLNIGFMNGEMDIANLVFEQSFSTGLGFHFSTGINYHFSNSFSLISNIGYRQISMEEIHYDNQSDTGFSSFYANGTDGETIVVNWSGLFVTLGLQISLHQKND